MIALLMCFVLSRRRTPDGSVLPSCESHRQAVTRGLADRREWRAALADCPVALTFPGCLIAAQQKWLRTTRTPVASITLARRKSGHKADLALARILQVVGLAVVLVSPFASALLARLASGIALADPSLLGGTTRPTRDPAA